MLPDSSLLPSSTLSATHESSLLNSSKDSPLLSQATSLKVVIVGNEGVGKTTFVRRFVSEELGIPIDEVTPTASSSVSSLSSPSPLLHPRRRRRERPPGTISTGAQQNQEVGLDIYELELPATEEASSEARMLPVVDGNTGDGGSNGNLRRFSIWDFSGKAESLQAVQKLFFTTKTLYVVLWDMAAKDVSPLECESTTATANAASVNNSSHSQNSIKWSKQNITNSSISNSINNNNSASYSQSHLSTGSSTFNLTYDSDSDSSDYDYYNDCDVDMYNQEELRILKRKLEKDIDKKVQCWIDRIQAIAPGATIVPIATHTDRLSPNTCRRRTDERTAKANATTSTTDESKQKEVKKRCWLLKERLLSNESRKIEVLKENISTTSAGNASSSSAEGLLRPNFQFGNIQKDGQVFPHAVTASCIYYEEDEEMDDVSMDEILLEMHESPGRECEEHFSSARNFIVDTALTVATGEKQRARQELVCGERDSSLPEKEFVNVDIPSVQASLATVMLRDVRQKLWHCSKIVQTNYFTEKFETRETSNNAQMGSGDNFSNSAVLTALNSLHLSGELCYFGGVIPSGGIQHHEESLESQLLSDFVVLDPTWLIESVDFILQYAKKFIQKTSNNRTAMGFPEDSSRQRATNCPTIEKEELRRLWKNRSSTKQGLGLAEHYHQFQHSDKDEESKSGVADRVFEFIQYLLIRHDVFVPLSYQESGLRHFFLPCLLRQKNACSSIITDSSQSTLLVSSSSILQDLTHSNHLIPENERYTDSQIDLDSENLQEACHGFVIVDTAPETLMERTIVHIIKSLIGTLSTNCEPIIEAEEIYFWKDSFRLKLRAHSSDKKEEQKVEINGVLLEAPGCGTSSRILTCENVLVTYLQGCDDSVSQELWRQTCLGLHEAMQNALDEIPGIEYREEGICPHCLRKKPIGDTGTWTLSKLKSAVKNEEAFVRCRHGHRTETKLNGLLHCQLVDPPAEDSVKSHNVDQIPSSAISPIFPPHRQHPEFVALPSFKSKREKQNLPSAVKSRNRDQVRSSPNRSLIKSGKKRANKYSISITSNKDKISASVGHVGKTEPTEQMETEKEVSKENDSKVVLLLDTCKAKMERLFVRKNHLSLDNQNLAEFQIPMKKIEWD